MLVQLKEHTTGITSTWLLGLITWISSATNYIGLIGAFVGAVAGIMLVSIRWDDFMKSKPVRLLSAVIRRWKNKG